MKLRKIISTMFCIALLTFNCFTINASEYSDVINNIDSSNSEISGNQEDIEALMKLGIPLKDIARMPEGQRAFIVENVIANAKYEGMETYECGTSSSNEGIATCATEVLDESRMTISVVCFKVSVNGEVQYAIYPSFVWKEAGNNLRNDTFAFALYSGWEVVPQSICQMKVNLFNSYGIQQSRILQPTDTSQYGYGYGLADVFAAPGGYHEGHAVCYARKKDPNATNAICVKYIHDTTPLLNISYGINIGIASIGLSSDSPKLQVYAKNLSFSYNNWK